MEISDVAKQSGIPASTLRYYEERGLIRSTGRRGLRRLFDADVLERLGLISLGRAAGFALDEIAAMILYLASDESSFCTGGDYPIDGGHSCGSMLPGMPKR